MDARQETRAEWLLALSGALSVIVGVAMIVLPGAGALALVWLIASYAIALGSLMLVLAFRPRSKQTTAQRQAPRGASRRAYAWSGMPMIFMPSTPPAASAPAHSAPQSSRRDPELLAELEEALRRDPEIRVLDRRSLFTEKSREAVVVAQLDPLSRRPCRGSCQRGRLFVLRRTVRA